MTDNSDNSVNSKLFDIAQKIAIGLLFMIVTWQYNAQQKLEERLYALQGNVFTDQKAASLEDRISKSIDVRFSDLSNRLDLLLRLVQSSQENKK